MQLVRFTVLVVCVVHTLVGAQSTSAPRTQNEWIEHLVSSKHAKFADFSNANIKTRPHVRHSENGSGRTRLTEAELKQVPIEARIDDYLQGLMSCYQGLGLTVSVVRGTETVFSKGYGLRSIDPPLPVDTDTLFGIGSNTKAFTTTLLAMMEDEGLFDWDAPVTDYIPEFELEDPYATRRARTRDLVSHRLGLTRNDFWWMSDPDIPRERLPNHVKNFAMNLEFREKWQYNNFGFQIAGDILPRILNGSSWEDELVERIFKPLGMDTATPSTAEAVAGGNYAFPYSNFESDSNGRPIYTALPQDFNTVIDRHVAPAGSIVASANDMQHWLKFLLSYGVSSNGERLVSQEALIKTFNAEAFSGTKGLLQPTFPASLVSTDYALGWYQDFYRGHAVLQHSGGTLGHTSLIHVYVDPRDGLGIFMSGIGDQADIGTIEYLAHMFIADLYLGYEPWLNVANSCSFPCTWLPCAAERDNAASDENPSGGFEFGVGFTGSRGDDLMRRFKERRFDKESVKCAPEEVQEFLGSYDHPGWGRLEVSYSDELEAMVFSFNAIEGVVVDVGAGDIMEIIATNEYATLLGSDPFGTLTFNRNNQGLVVSVTGNNWDADVSPVFERDRLRRRYRR